MGIQIVEKPDWVTWDDIHNVLVAAHAENRKNGIIMAFSVKPGDEIKEIIGKEGVMLIALDGNKVVGTAGLEIKQENRWYYHGKCAYQVFASVLPDYRGHGIYKSLSVIRDKKAKERNISVLIGATHENNKRRFTIWKEEGFKFVEFRAGTDHYNVIAAKWLNGDCPYSDFYRKLRFNLSKWYYKTRYKIDEKKGLVRRFGI